MWALLFVAILGKSSKAKASWDQTEEKWWGLDVKAQQPSGKWDIFLDAVLGTSGAQTLNLHFSSQNRVTCEKSNDIIVQICFFCFNVYAKYSVITCGWKIWIFISILSADIQQKFFVAQFFTFYTKFITCRGLMVDSKSNKCNSNYKFMFIFTTENLPISIHGQQAFYHTIKTRIHFRHIESIQLSSGWLIFVAILVPILIPWPYLFTYHCQVSSRLVTFTECSFLSVWNWS